MESEDPVSLTKRIFVGAVPVKMDENTLKEYFSTFGLVTYFKLGRNKKNQEPLGFAFIEFKDEEVTRRVLETKHNVHGREIDVKQFALDKDIDRQQQEILRRKVYLKGLPPYCDQTKLFDIFSKFGLVDKAFILYNHKNGSSRGFGFVEFKDEHTASRVLGQRVEICGKEILVSMAVERQKGKKGIPQHSEEPVKDSRLLLKKLDFKREKSEGCLTASCSLTPVQNKEPTIKVSREKKTNFQQLKKLLGQLEDSDQVDSTDIVPETCAGPHQRIGVSMAIGSRPIRIPGTESTLPEEGITSPFKAHLKAVSSFLHNRGKAINVYRFNQCSPKISQYTLFKY